MGRPIVLVLDDYHLIHDAHVHSSIEFLLRHLPEDVHLAIATRSDPPLPLGRLRARGEMTELRAADLRLSGGEAAGLLRAALGVDLEPDDVARLVSRTEGWAAGLYLAALSLRGRADAAELIGSFAGDDRHIVDYLSTEVLAGQPPEIREFLLRTAVLGRLCGPLCDAVTGGGGSAAVLERIERENLFLVPLDTTREWYRYHHLFGELLRHELERSHPGAAASLREGLQETVTLQRLGIDGQLWRTLASTNPIESMIGICRHASRNVKHWQSGDMCLRWTAAGMLEAERQFRKIIGYKHLARLAVAVEADVAAQRAAFTVPSTPTEPAATLATAH